MSNVWQRAVIFGALIAVGASVSLLGCRRAPEPPPPVVVEPPPPPPVPPPVTRPEDALRPVVAGKLPPLIDEGSRATLAAAVRHSRRWYSRRPPERELVFGPRRVRAGEMVAALDLVLGWLDADLSPAELAQRVVESFDLFQSVGDHSGEMLITGYYEPVIAGSLRRSAEFSVPIYGRPSDLIDVDLGTFRESLRGERIAGRLQGHRLVPYPSRGEVRRGTKIDGPVLAWAKDPVELFFLEVQGSGAVSLPDGGEIRIGYAAANGRPYRSIGRKLIDEGKIPPEQMSMQALRSWLRDHPGELHRVLDHNESQVFFRRLEGAPTGNLGFAVTAERSVALDHRLFPPAALGFLMTEIPAAAEDGSTISAGLLRRFVLNQDTGGAIRGSDRADLFWGRGEVAAERAGLMKQPGALFFLVPKQ